MSMDHFQLMQWVLHILDQVKVFHWTTRQYSAHKALDELHASLSDLSDTLIEAVMGKYSKELSKNKNTLKLEPVSSDPSKAISFIEAQRDQIEQAYKSFSTSKSTDIPSILDDMQNAMNKALYLLTLQ